MINTNPWQRMANIMFKKDNKKAVTHKDRIIKNRS